MQKMMRSICSQVSERSRARGSVRTLWRLSPVCSQVRTAFSATLVAASPGYP